MRISVLLSTAAIGLFLHGCASQPSTATQVVSADFVPSETCRSNGVIEDSCVVELRIINKGMNDCEITLVDPNSNLITAGKGMQGKFTFWRIVTAAAMSLPRMTALPSSTTFDRAVCERQAHRAGQGLSVAESVPGAEGLFVRDQRDERG